jgi:hypothetical protein
VESDGPEGPGIAIGETGTFSFTTDQRPVHSVPGVVPGVTSYAHTWLDGEQRFLFSGTLDVPGPVPEPGTLGPAAVLRGAFLLRIRGGATRRWA